MLGHQDLQDQMANLDPVDHEESQAQEVQSDPLGPLVQQALQDSVESKVYQELRARVESLEQPEPWEWLDYPDLQAKEVSRVNLGPQVYEEKQVNPEPLASLDRWEHLGTWVRWVLLVPLDPGVQADPEEKLGSADHLDPLDLKDRVDQEEKVVFLDTLAPLGLWVLWDLWVTWDLRVHQACKVSKAHQELLAHQVNLDHAVIWDQWGPAVLLGPQGRADLAENLACQVNLENLE